MECGSIIREIMLAIDDSINKRATIDSEIAKLTKKYVDSLRSENKARELF